MARLSMLVYAALLLAPAGVRAQSSCTVDGRPYRLPISVPAISDAIVVTGHSAEVVLDAARASATGRVLSPIAFEGTVDPLELRMYSRPGRSLADATLWLGPGGNVHLLADGSVVALIGAGVTATLPSLPCDELTLTPPPDRGVDTSRLPPVTHRIDAMSVLALYASPDARRPSATIRTTQSCEITVADTSGDRVLVSTELGMSRIQGWVDVSLVTAIAPHEAVLYMMGTMIGGACGRTDHSYAYEGPAHVRAGAMVRGPTGAAWGRVTRTLAVARIGVRSSDRAQVELIRIAGLESSRCGEELQYDLAVVSADDVQRPASARPRRRERH